MNLGERVLRLAPPLRRSLDQVPRHAADWERANSVAREATGPLWIVLGDSTAQAIGIASGIEHGYVGRVRRLLEARDGESWRVVNLSRSGAVVADVLDTQLPALALQPSSDLVTCVIGGNDLRRTPVAELLAGLEQLLAGLPVGAVVGNLPKGLKEAKARVANALVAERAAARGLRIADLWSHTGPPWRGKYADGLHPNDKGLAEWVAAIGAALGLPPELPVG